MINKDWNQYEVAERWGGWAIQEKSSKSVWAIFTNKQLAINALNNYKKTG